MNSNELLELGFIDTSYVEENENFTEFTLTTSNIEIQVSGIDNVEMKFLYVGWVDVSNCKTIEDIKHLIRLFE